LKTARLWRRLGADPEPTPDRHPAGLRIAAK
jgi:hypothetical protein